MWTRKSTLLTGAGLALLFLASVTKSWHAAGLAVSVLSFVTIGFFLFRRQPTVEAARPGLLERVFEGEDMDVNLELTNTGNRALFMEVRDNVPRQMNVESGSNYAFLALNRKSTTRLHYNLRTPLLGVYGLGPVSLRLEDPFGLFYEERDVPPETTMHVLPRAEDMKKVTNFSNLPMPILGAYQVNRPGDGFDFFALREYAAGDTIRMVNWKASARSGKLVVNQREKATAAELTVFFDGRAILNVGPEETSPRVLGARAMASLTEWAIGRGDQLRLVLYNDHLKEFEPAAPDQQIPQILTTLAELDPKGNFPLKLAVNQILPSLKEGSPCIIVSPALDDPTIVEAVSILLANEMTLVFVSPKPKALPGLDPEFAEVLLQDRDRTLRALRGYGVYVFEVEETGSLSMAMEQGGLRA